MTLLERVAIATSQVPVIDLHTHLFPPNWKGFFLSGIDDLLTYHYLVAEVLRADPQTSPELFFQMPQSVQADLVWQTLFVDRTPLSEAQVGVFGVLTALGLDPNVPDLTSIRKWFSEQSADAMVDRAFKLAKVESVVMTNDPFDPLERERWFSEPTRDARFLSALRVDPLVNSFDAVAPDLPNGPEAFLEEWVERMKPKYMAVSLSDDFAYPDSDGRACALKTAILPVARRHRLPVALMIGVRRQINPRLKMAGDGSGAADLTCVQNLCGENPDVNFLVTTLALQNAHPLCVLARKFANLKIFGAWWFMNNPSLIESVTDMRFEMLGRDFIAQHSDARVLEQLIYKWNHSRGAIAMSLAKRFEALERSGGIVTDAAIAAEAHAILRGNTMSVLGIGA